MSYDVEKIRKDFPILSTRVGEYPLTYLDSANTSQKPQVVIDALSEHYARHNANVARAMHQLGLESTQAYEGGRERIARFIGASRPEEVVALSNASEALNLCAHTLGERLGPGDEVVISVMEHHSNLVPWQLVCQRTGATLRWFDITDEGRLDLEKAEAEGLINEHTKVVSLTLASNVLGTINPIGMIAEQAHAVGAVMVVDASQAVPQMPVDVSALGADLVAFTGHKMCGPTGIGILWGRYDLLAELPHRFEAGTPPIAQLAALGVAADYLDGIGMEAIAEHEHELAARMLEGLQTVKGVHILGPIDATARTGTVSFTIEGVHPHDAMSLMDGHGVAVRGGHHCARPLHEWLGIQSSLRASSYLYSTADEVDRLVESVEYARSFFAGGVA